MRTLVMLAAVLLASAVVDAEPAPDPLASAPVWVFRHDDGKLVQTWTLRFADGHAALDVVAGDTTTHYVGTADGTDAIAVKVTAGRNQMSLTCKHGKLAIAAKCGGKATTKVVTLDCFHPDYQAPMSFGAAPGLEYATRADCTGYHRIAGS